MNKIIKIDGTRYALPEAMTTKEVQALAGFLVTLTKVDYEYSFGSGDNFYYAQDGATVSIDEQALMTRAEAKAASKKSNAEYEARKAAEAAGTAA
jgi:hypothetical protein